MRSVSLKKFFLFLISFQFLFYFSTPVFASDQSNPSPEQNDQAKKNLDEKFCTIIEILQGGPMKSVATIAVMAVGIGTFTGRFQWATALVTVAGIIVIFSASSVVRLFAGTDAEYCKEVK